MSSTPEISVRTECQSHARYPGEPVVSGQPADHRLYLSRSDLEGCKCDAHRFESNEIRYARLADKECRLRDELMKVNREMASLASEMLQDVCETRDSRRSVYKTDYEKKDYEPTVDSSTRPCVKPTVVDTKAYKDPFEFRYSAMEMTTPPPVQPTCFLQIPEGYSFWYKPFAGESEYTDEFSKTGLRTMRNQQQYLQPLLLAKGRSGDCSL